MSSQPCKEKPKWMLSSYNTNKKKLAILLHWRGKRASIHKTTTATYKMKNLSFKTQKKNSNYLSRFRQIGIKHIPVHLISSVNQRMLSSWARHELNIIQSSKKYCDIANNAGIARIARLRSLKRYEQRIRLLFRDMREGQRLDYVTCVWIDVVWLAASVMTIEVCHRSIPYQTDQCLSGCPQLQLPVMSIKPQMTSL